MVYNYNEDIAIAFIIGLQVTNPFYEHLMKNDVTRMRDILIRAQKYIQIEESTQSTPIRPETGSRAREAKTTISPKEESKPNSSVVRRPSRHVAESSKRNDAEHDLLLY